jgi:hypothetical protein
MRFHYKGANQNKIPVDAPESFIRHFVVKSQWSGDHCGLFSILKIAQCDRRYLFFPDTT